MFNKEIRCGQCCKKLAEGIYSQLSIKCPRCKAFNHLKAESPPPERKSAPSSDHKHD